MVDCGNRDLSAGAQLGSSLGFGDVDLPLSADIQGECGNPTSGESTMGIWLKLRY